MAGWEVVRARPIFEGDLLNLHGRGGAIFIFQIETSAGVFQDISGRSLVFELDGVATVPLTPGDDDTQQVITLTETLLRGLEVGKAVNFAVLDVTGEPVPPPLWSGALRTYGFSADPPAP